MSWTSPFSLSGSWYKGNLHTHTTQSDGLYSPEDAIGWYRQNGYDFLAISDHWVLTKGKQIAPGFVTLTASELHGERFHMLSLGLKTLPHQTPDITAAQAASAVVARQGIAFMAHPYWLGQTSAEIMDVADIAGIEVYNSVCEKMDGLGHAEVHWDDLLAAGRRLNAVAVDDVHWRHGAQGRGYVMVKAETLDERSLLEAIRAGSFYASTGVVIQDLRLVAGEDGGLSLRVHCSGCDKITFYADGPKGRRFHAEDGALLRTADLPLSPEMVYVRVQCVDREGRMAWTNPVYMADVF